MSVTVSTHVLDTASGRPAAGVTVTLTGAGVESRLVTGEDGRGRFDAEFATGVYVVRFEPGVHSRLYAEIALEVRLDEDRHYHLPLLLAPFGASTYLGT